MTFYRKRKFVSFQITVTSVSLSREVTVENQSLIPSTVQSTLGWVFVFQQYAGMKGRWQLMFTSIKLWRF